MEEVAKKTNYVDITPLRKGKRILTFLADLFLNFILAFLIFNIIVTPTAKKICDFETLNKNHEEYTAKMYSLFYENKLVYKSEEFPEYDLTDNIDYTFDNFLSYYACDDSTMLEENSMYGNKIENEVFYHYFNDILGNKELYFANLEAYNYANYFVKDETALTGIKLKDDIRLELEPYFDTRNEMSQIGNEYYKNIKDDLYFPLFAEVMSSIEEHDLTHPNVDCSYLTCKTEIEKLEKFHKNLLTICAAVSYVFSCLLYYFLIPCLTENKRTLAQAFMKNHRMEYTTLNPIKNTHFIASAFYAMLTNACLVVFFPMMLVPFNYLFSINALLYTSIISLIFDIIGLVFILINKFNRSWQDILTSMVCISDESLAEIYKSKGYKI